MVYALAMFAEQGSVLAVDATAVIVFLTALLLIWILNPLLFNPINRVLEEREYRTQGYHSETKSMLAECDHKLARYEAALRRARAETYEILEQRRKEALQHRAQIIETAKQEMAECLTVAQQQIRRQVADAQTQLAAESQIFAERIATSLLGRQTEEVRRAS